MFFVFLGTMPPTPLFAMKNHCFTSGYCKLDSRIVQKIAPCGPQQGDSAYEAQTRLTSRTPRGPKKAERKDKAAPRLSHDSTWYIWRNLRSLPMDYSMQCAEISYHYGPEPNQKLTCNNTAAPDKETRGMQVSTNPLGLGSSRAFGRDSAHLR